MRFGHRVILLFLLAFQKGLNKNEIASKERLGYKIGIEWDIFMPKIQIDKIKAKIKLSAEKRKEFGKVQIRTHKQELSQ